VASVLLKLDSWQVVMNRLHRRAHPLGSAGK
jgi:hypothetical protein